MADLRVVVVGAGGVGLSLGGFLLKAGYNVSFVATKRTAEILKKNGFKISGIFGKMEFRDVDIIDYDSISKPDYVLICTKTTANEQIADNLCRIKNRLSNSKLVVVQNGWGNAEKFLGCFEEERVFAARIITGFYRKALNEIEITVHADDMVVGNIFKKEISFQVKDLCDALKEGGFPVRVSLDVDKYLWAKMLYNCALNPLGAVLNVEYGRLAEKPSTRMIMDRIIDEIFDVMDAAGFKTFFDTAESYKKEFYSKLIPATAGHRSSMLQDILAGNKTEIDSLNGVIVRLGEKYDVDVSYNRFITHLIQFFD
ncbi:ketopantoate reductase family protein [Hippea jasoniae]|uniref:ketopantoate reductase family protein n=1 Tax=Hippea jasoniae TaxID=944479 RepID=UPI000557CCC2|nr:2-dehydropantoate 2-reductase [Hippea jasoniae]